MSCTRVAVLCLLLIALPAQSLVTLGCACESQEHAIDSDMPMPAEHMGHDSDGTDPVHDKPHDKPHSCDSIDAMCECGACGQLPAITATKSDLSLFRTGLNENAIVGYTEPVPIPAFRPPITG